MQGCGAHTQNNAETLFILIRKEYDMTIDSTVSITNFVWDGVEYPLKLPLTASVIAYGANDVYVSYKEMGVRGNGESEEEAVKDLKETFGEYFKALYDIRDDRKGTLLQKHWEMMQSVSVLKPTVIFERSSV